MIALLLNSELVGRKENGIPQKRRGDFSFAKLRLKLENSMKQENQLILEEKPRTIERRQNQKASEGAEENAFCIGQNAQKRNEGIWRKVVLKWRPRH